MSNTYMIMNISAVELFVKSGSVYYKAVLENIDTLSFRARSLFNDTILALCMFNCRLVCLECTNLNQLDKMCGDIHFQLTCLAL